MHDLEEDLNYDARVLVQQADQLLSRLDEGPPANPSPGEGIQDKQSAQDALDRLTSLSVKATKDVLFRKKWTVQQNAAGRTGDDLIKRLQVLIKKYELLDQNS